MTHSVESGRAVARLAILSAALSATGALAADVEVTANAASLALDGNTGSTAHVAAGVTLGPPPFPGGPAVTATLRPWTLVNDGKLSGANTVTFKKGGEVDNAAGATIASTTSAIVLGVAGVGGAGVVVNAGSITGGGGPDIVLLFGGGSVTNLAGGSITTTNGNNAVAISGGASRVVTNNGVISNTGASSFATGVYVAGGASAIVNGAGASIFGSYNGIYSSASAPLSLTNAGAISSARGPAVEGAGGGSIVNSGSIESAAGSGRAALLFTGAGSVTNSGTIRSTGSGVAIAFSGAAAHTLTLATGSTIAGAVNGGTGTDALALQGSGAQDISQFSGFETLSMQGAAWTLTGTGAFSSGVTLQSGLTRVDGRLASPSVEVQSGATLTGAGVVAGAVANSGAVRVDSGQFTIDGNYVQRPGSTLAVGVTPASSGLLSVTGAARIDGGAVRALAASGDYGPNASYTILTAVGGRSGVFDEATTDLAFYSPSLSYDANNVYLKLVRNSVDFSSVGGTLDQIAAGRALELAGLAHPIVAPALLLTAAEARAAFDGLSGEIHSSLRALLVDESRTLRDTVLERQRQAVAGSTVPVFTVWAHGFGDWARLGGDGNAATARMSTAGGLAGVDVALGDSRLGGAAGGGHSAARVDARASSGDMESAHVAVYGDTRAGDLGLRVGGAYSHHDVTTMRRIAFRGFADAPHADYGAHTAQAFGEASYRGLFRGFWPLLEGAETFAGVAHVRVASDGFRESGGSAALTVAGAQTATTFSSIGVRARTSAWTIGAAAVSARASVAWSHAFDRIVPTTGMSLVPGSAPVFVAGAPLAVDALLIEAGLDAAVAPNALASLVYSSRLASGAEAHALIGRFLWQF
ncbi:MAG TPA: autotransporter domain-containing protein [Methylosinus sp.]|jgi:uncharacterized protein with beta-barrel porin domain|uniref:autotransporter outer membrane beta-barrel domain-containing protein n=1 Tax=Methylosinus sp. TaxID=427 RepID=UPI002F9259A8